MFIIMVRIPVCPLNSLTSSWQTRCWKHSLQIRFHVHDSRRFWHQFWKFSRGLCATNNARLVLGTIERRRYGYVEVKFWHLHMAAEIKIHHTRWHFHNLLLSCLGEPVSTIVWKWNPLWASAAVVDPLQGWTSCAVRDALLPSTVVMPGMWVTVTFRSGHSPLNSLSYKVFSATELLLTQCFLFLTPFSVNSRDYCRWCPRRPAVSEILKPPSLALNYITLHFSPFWCLVWTTAEPLNNVCMIVCIELLQ